MTTFVTGFRAGRFVWTVLVTGYALVFFMNFLGDALGVKAALPSAFAVLFVLWVAVEYYLGSPFFQSGVVEPSAFWRGVFAFFVYPYIGYLGADFIWWHWTQIPGPVVVFAMVGLAVFALGTYVRLRSLLDLVRIAQTRLAGGAKRQSATSAQAPVKRIVGLPLQRICRHPRYLGTLVQLAGMSLVFCSWGGLVLVSVLGLPLLLVQAQYEERRLTELLGSEAGAYRDAVPFLWPRFR
jgi:protein-S-isoprenylcysteine O-methyltransferase Ste14